MRDRAGVAEARRELRCASWRAWRRFAFSCRSSLKSLRGTLHEVSDRRTLWIPLKLLLRRLLRRGRHAVFGGARHRGGVDLFVAVVALFVNTSAGSRVRGPQASRPALDHFRPVPGTAHLGVYISIASHSLSIIHMEYS